MHLMYYLENGKRIYTLKVTFTPSSFSQAKCYVMRKQRTYQDAIVECPRLFFLKYFYSVE